MMKFMTNSRWCISAFFLNRISWNCNPEPRTKSHCLFSRNIIYLPPDLFSLLTWSFPGLRELRLHLVLFHVSHIRCSSHKHGIIALKSCLYLHRRAANAALSVYIVHAWVARQMRFLASHLSPSLPRTCIEFFTPPSNRI